MLSYDDPHQRQKTKTIVTHLFSDIMLKLSFPRILHSDNGTEFKSKLFEYLTQKLGIKKTYISPHHPQANGKLESSHRFIKDCIYKFSVDSVQELDQLLPYATAAFIWILNEHFQESPHFLYFKYDSYFPPVAAFLQPKLRYLGSDKGKFHLHKMRHAYKLADLNAKEAYSKLSKE